MTKKKDPKDLVPNRRPPMFDNPDQLEKKINGYWGYIKRRKINPSITGIAYFLGFECRASFYDYERKPEFSYLIKRARLAVENFYEQSLIDARNAAGPIFALKNFGWVDEQQINISAERQQTAMLFPTALKVLGKDEPIQIEQSAGDPG